MLSSFSVGGVTLYPYSLLMILGAGVCLGSFCLLTVRRHRGKTDENAFAIEMLIVSVAAALPAAMLFDSLFKWAESGVFRLGGATFYGGLIGALALFPLLLLAKKNRTVSVLERLNDLAPGIAAGHAIGRVGCFLGGCCFGSPTDCALGVVFPEGSLPYEFYGGAVKIHPTQLYEAAFLAALFAVLLLLGKRSAFAYYLVGYGAWRFGIEFLRADDRGSFFGLPLSPAQVISLALAAVGAALLVAAAVRRARQKLPPAPSKKDRA